MRARFSASRRRRGDTRSALVVVTEGATDPERYAEVIGA